ncbi:MAG: CDP-archaeol synthase, partial [Candidatus Micrarchaeota archaeon]
MLENWLEVIILVLPAYVANASPVILGGGTPVDFGRLFYDKKRILGDGKTWKG